MQILSFKVCNNFYFEIWSNKMLLENKNDSVTHMGTFFLEFRNQKRIYYAKLISFPKFAKLISFSKFVAKLNISLEKITQIVKVENVHI